jgi:dihydrofolate reductase
MPRKVVASTYITLDGYIDEPGKWSFPFWSEEASQFKARELFASDAQLLGRLTYEGFAAAWPTMEGTGEFGEKMNSMPKYVVSSSLDKVDWTGSQLIKGNVAEEVSKLKERPGQDLLLCGSAQLFNALMQENLIDVYRFMLHPIILGKGRRLFPAGGHERILDLTETQRFGSGIVVFEYRPAKT